MKKKVITITKTVYEADDGTEFDSPNACKEHEEECAETKVAYRAEQIPHTTILANSLDFHSSYNDVFIVFAPKSNADAEALIKWLTLFSPIAFGLSPNAMKREDGQFDAVIVDAQLKYDLSWELKDVELVWCCYVGFGSMIKRYSLMIAREARAVEKQLGIEPAPVLDNKGDRIDQTELAGQIIDGIEDWLHEIGVIIQNPERDDNEDLDPEDSTNIYGSDYDRLEEHIINTLHNWGLLKTVEDRPKKEVP